MTLPEGFEEETMTLYHNGIDVKTRDRARKEKAAAVDNRDRLMIAWDGEGINLSGDDRPQHYVLFGCSAEPDSPLLIQNSKDNLDFGKIAHYVCNMGDRYPGAFHIGYGFKYDQNMIIRSLPWRLKEKLHLSGNKGIKYKVGSAEFYLRVTPGKELWITRHWRGKKTTVRIHDIHAFFASSFVSAYVKLFRDDIANDENWQTVVEGKSARGLNTWDDMADIQTYWRAEVLAMARLADRFRHIMYDAEFNLTSWYGPGALANYIRRTKKLKAHEYGAKERNIPTGLHSAAKSAFYGGRFEQFHVGRIQGPVYGLDINSAYPYAFSRIPSLAAPGFWQEVDEPSSDPDTFGVYHIHYDGGSSTLRHYPLPKREAQPLPWRDQDGNVKYNTITQGWYWRPEMDMVRELYPDETTVMRGWEWVPAWKVKPWAWIADMYEQRRALKAAGNPVEMAYKLAMNSLYGKMAQRVGGRDGTPPDSHSLSIAGYVTSTCRAMIMRVLHQIPQSELIAVETDGIYTTRAPELLDLPTGMGKGLGQWDKEVYDECIYLQSGVYLMRQGEDWGKRKSRGFNVRDISPEGIGDYLATLMPGPRVWPNYTVPVTRTKFVTLGAAIGRSRTAAGTIIPPKAAALHCKWIPDPKVINPGGKEKRIHLARMCKACTLGLTPNEAPHTLVTNPGFNMRTAKGQTWNIESRPYRLPWEADYEEEKWRATEISLSGLLSAEEPLDLGLIA